MATQRENSKIDALTKDVGTLQTDVAVMKNDTGDSSVGSEVIVLGHN